MDAGKCRIWPSFKPNTTRALAGELSVPKGRIDPVRRYRPPAGTPNQEPAQSPPPEADQDERCTRELPPALALFADADDVEMLALRRDIGHAALERRIPDPRLPCGRPLRLRQRDLVALVINDNLVIVDVEQAILR